VPSLEVDAVHHPRGVWGEVRRQAVSARRRADTPSPADRR
jgi:hypothetical protein